MSVAHTNSNIQRKDDLKNNGCDSHSISPLFRMHEKKIAGCWFFYSLTRLVIFFHPHFGSHTEVGKKWAGFQNVPSVLHLSLRRYKKYFKFKRHANAIAYYTPKKMNLLRVAFTTIVYVQFKSSIIIKHYIRSHKLKTFFFVLPRASNDYCGTHTQSKASP